MRTTASTTTPAAPVAVPSLRLRLKKASDGSVAAFALHRADGSYTLQRNLHPFFPLHDLTHYAIETTLRMRRAFYGLVAEGWSFEDFGVPWPRGPLPEEALRAELLAGYLDLERGTGYLMSAAALHEKLTEFYVHRGLDASAVSPIDEEDLRRIRARRGALAARWRDTPPGSALELSFTPGDPAAGAG